MGPCARTCVYMGEATHMRGSSQNLLQEVCQHLTPSALVASFGFSGLRVGSRARTRKFESHWVSFLCVPLASECWLG